MNYENVIDQIARIQGVARSAAAHAVNQLLTLRNWLIGAYIVEYEQNGEDRAAYGEQLLRAMASDLARRGQSGLSFSNLKNFRQFALSYPALAIGQTVSGQFDPLAELAEQNAAGADELSPASATPSGVAGEGSDRLRPWRFPSLEVRHAQRQSLPWQDSQYYARLLATLSWSGRTCWSWRGLTIRSSAPFMSWSASKVAGHCAN